MIRVSRSPKALAAVLGIAALLTTGVIAVSGASARTAGAGAHAAKSKPKPKPKPPAAIHATTGIGDEQPAMFSNGAYKALHTRIARYVTPYDVMSNHSANDLPRLRAWLAAAARDHVQPLVAFYHSDRTPKKMPSVAAYTKAVKAFLKAFPSVRLLQPWNEANRGTVREPGDSYTSPSAKQAAQYYLAVKRLCSQVHRGRRRRARLDRREGDDRLHERLQARRRLQSTCRRSGGCTTTPTPTASMPAAPRRCSRTPAGRSG